jgi:hypothetical protein
MKRLHLEHLSDDELVERFADVAEEMGSAVLDSEIRRINRAYDLLRAIDLVLRARGSAARLNLAWLLTDDRRFVRYYAAAKLLGLLPERARPVIEANANDWFDAIAGDARGLLRAFDAGEYKPN